MLLTEYDEIRAMALFREEGENRLAKLMDKLLTLDRCEDAERAATDPAYRAKLYQEFQLA